MRVFWTGYCGSELIKFVLLRGLGGLSMRLEMVLLIYSSFLRDYDFLEERGMQLEGKGLCLVKLK